MKHYIHTGFGVSESHNKWDEKNKAGGLSQGNEGASVSWHSHMLPLKKAYEEETGHGVAYSNLDRT